MDSLADGWRLRLKTNKKITERWVFRHEWFLDVPVAAAQSHRPGEDVHWGIWGTVRLVRRCNEAWAVYPAAYEDLREKFRGSSCELGETSIVCSLAVRIVCIQGVQLVLVAPPGGRCQGAPHTHTHPHTRTTTNTCTHTHTYTSTHTSKTSPYIHIHTSMNTPADTYTHAYTCINTRTQTNSPANIYKGTYTRLHIYKQARTQHASIMPTDTNTQTHR